MWNLLRRWRFTLLSAFAVISVTAYTWSYNEWRQQEIWVHLDSMTQDASGVIHENGVQVYPDPKRWFYAPVRIIFEGYLRPKSHLMRANSPGTIQILTPADQSEPEVRGFST